MNVQPHVVDASAMFVLPSTRTVRPTLDAPLAHLMDPDAVYRDLVKFGFIGDYPAPTGVIGGLKQGRKFGQIAHCAIGLREAIGDPDGLWLPEGAMALLAACGPTLDRSPDRNVGHLEGALSQAPWERLRTGGPSHIDTRVTGLAARHIVRRRDPDDVWVPGAVDDTSLTDATGTTASRVYASVYFWPEPFTPDHTVNRGELHSDVISAWSIAAPGSRFLVLVRLGHADEPEARTEQADRALLATIAGKHNAAGAVRARARLIGFDARIPRGWPGALIWSGSEVF